MAYFKVFLLKYFILMMTFAMALSNDTRNCSTGISLSNGTQNSIDDIFSKYGDKANDSQVIKKSRFEQFLASLNLGRIRVECEKDDMECLKDAHDSELKQSGKQRKRRDVTGETYNTTNHLIHWINHRETCWSADDILNKHGFGSSLAYLTKTQFLHVCPSLIQQIDSKVCVHYHQKLPEPIEVPSRKEAWIYGIVSITIISLLSLTVIAMIPCLKKSFYHKVMSYLVALAVGTLAGDAMLHLIPHAFAEGANAAVGVEMSEADELKQHYSQVWRALFVLLGMYLFFFVEQMMQWKSMCGKSEDQAGHGGSKEELHDLTSSPTSADDPDKSTVYFKNSENEEKARIESYAETDDHSHGNGHAHSHGHSHGKKNITKDTKISSVAWMVIVGDGFHNFSDGLAVGVAYSASISSGLSTTIAVFCHELPHELGDFAVLIKSGMSIKQAIVYNLVSAVLAYLGLIIGILIGGYETGRHFILSITAGLFLYVSLADMLPELSHQKIPRESRCSSYLCQHLGILSGIGMMLFISLYEHAM